MSKRITHQSPSDTSPRQGTKSSEEVSWPERLIRSKVPTLNSGVAIAEHISRVAPAGQPTLRDLWIEAVKASRCVDADLLRFAYRAVSSSKSAQQSIITAALKNPAIGAARLLDVLSMGHKSSNRSWAWWVEALGVRGLIPYHSPLGEKIMAAWTEAINELGLNVAPSTRLNSTDAHSFLWPAARLFEMLDTPSIVLDAIVNVLEYSPAQTGRSAIDKHAGALWHHPNRSAQLHEYMASRLAVGFWAREDVIRDGPHWENPGEVDPLLMDRTGRGISDTTLITIGGRLQYLEEKHDWNRMSEGFRAGVVQLLVHYVNACGPSHDQRGVAARQKLYDLLETLVTHQGFLTEGVVLRLTSSSDGHVRQWALLQALPESLASKPSTSPTARQS